MGFSALLASALCTFLLPLLLFLAAVKLWDLYCVSSRDPSCPLPLPPGTMGLPFFGETLQMVLQVRRGDVAGSGAVARLLLLVLLLLRGTGASSGFAELPCPGGDEPLPRLFFFFLLSNIFIFAPLPSTSGGNSCR